MSNVLFCPSFRRSIALDKAKHDLWISARIATRWLRGPSLNLAHLRIESIERETVTSYRNYENLNMPVNGDLKLHFDSIEDTIDALRNGEFIVVLDSTDRENEGDLIIAAEDTTTEKMAFMIRHTSGLICTPIPTPLTHHLDLPQMVLENTDPKRTAYTVSVDSADPSITTGISAHDRALTCRTLASKSATDSSFRRPGHVFPLRARDGGVRQRPGHTEAAVEFCRLAGKRPVGVICELVEDGEEIEGLAERREGGMMRRDACLGFGRKWGLKVCTIEDLIEYINKHDITIDTNGKV